MTDNAHGDKYIPKPTTFFCSPCPTSIIKWEPIQAQTTKIMEIQQETYNGHFNKEKQKQKNFISQDLLLLNPHMNVKVKVKSNAKIM